jgi:hypothetical protein
MGEARGREGVLFRALARRNCPALRNATADRLLRGFCGNRQRPGHCRSIQRATNLNLMPRAAALASFRHFQFAGCTVHLDGCVGLPTKRVSDMVLARCC